MKLNNDVWLHVLLSIMGSWYSGILSEVMFLQKKREAVVAVEVDYE